MDRPDTIEYYIDVSGRRQVKATNFLQQHTALYQRLFSVWNEQKCWGSEVLFLERNQARQDLLRLTAFKRFCMRMIADVNELQDLVGVEFQMVIPYHDIQDGSQDLWVDLLLANG